METRKTLNGETVAMAEETEEAVVIVEVVATDLIMMKRGLKMARKAQKAEEEMTCGKMATIIIKEIEEMLKGMAAVQTEEEEDDVLVEMLTVATNLITVTKDGEKMTKKAKEAKEKMTTGKVETTIREIGIPLNTEGAVVIVEAVATDLIMMKRALKMTRNAQEAVQEIK
ncbi:uncharacterized protein LOC126266420 [Aethina tumida]|uniref:uncharacterized protein LOC126266420 n=1 Tax=Aethina tumida TaxID=116153 RepID=UPI002148F43D|nr:uncharacterized protein LOC126266420 [Aethina tumida]